MSSEAPIVRPRITYRELAELPPDGKRYELFEGAAYMTPSPSRRHQEVLRRLFLAFHSAAEATFSVYFAPLDVVLAEDTAVQPDLMVVSPDRRGILQEVVRGAPDLVVEVVSPATSARDRGLKLETYARHGVGEYWIVDEDRGTIEIHRLDRASGAYRLAETCRGGRPATTPLLPRLSVTPDELFRG